LRSAIIGLVQHVPKALAAGVDLICAQGGEGGGHTGETPFSILIPACLDAIKGARSPLTGKPVHLVAAGGIYDGRGLAAALAYGAQAVGVFHSDNDMLHANKHLRIIRYGSGPDSSHAWKPVPQSESKLFECMGRQSDRALDCIKNLSSNPDMMIMFGLQHTPAGQCGSSRPNILQTGSNFPNVHCGHLLTGCF
jgi:Nitronate monooxygenase